MVYHLAMSNTVFSMSASASQQACRVNQKLRDKLNITKYAEEISESEATALFQESLPLSEDNIRKSLLLQALSTAHIVAVSIIPFRISHEHERIFAGRTGENHLGFISPIHFLEGQFSKHIIPLSSDRISSATRGIEEDIAESVRAVLTTFLNDPKALAISITYKNQSGALAARLWAKV